MPLYVSKCEECGEEQEVVQKFDDVPPKCKLCGGTNKRKINKSNFQLKGNCWAKQNYNKPHSRGHNKR